jgi:hypothetical protein
MAETTEQQAATIQELRDALANLCSAVKSRDTPRIIKAWQVGHAALEKTKEKADVNL